MAATACIVLASLSWILAVGVFQVSSNSMAPTLEGGPVSRDRIVCWKPAYLFRPPRRWEIVVFQAPANGADREVMPGLRSGGESGVTVKRLAALQGERLGFAAGDVWIRPPGDDSAPFRRQVKPDSVQRRLWIGVYAEDFADVNAEEFLYYWNREGAGEVRIGGDRSLSLVPDGGGGLGISYRPRVPVSHPEYSIADLPGIPDRYVLKQNILFKCPNPECGDNFEVLLDSPKIQGRCPACRLLSHEEAAVFYGFRSGLAETGRYAVGYTGERQGDPNHVRLQAYHFVPDLRLAFDVRLLPPAASCRVSLTGAGREAAVRLGGGKAVLSVDGRDAAEAVIPADGWTRVELERLDGAVRLFLGEERRSVFDRVVWEEEKPDTDWRAADSGAAIRVEGGGAAFRNLAIDRDIHYFGSSRHGGGSFTRHMDTNGEIGIGEGGFFPLGDNTTVSLDGRSWGAVDMSLLRGRAVMIWSPKERREWLPEP